jgi:hypothetical protein
METQGDVVKFRYDDFRGYNFSANLDGMTLN